MATRAGYLDVKFPSKSRGRYRKGWRHRWVVVQTMANLTEDRTLAKVVIYPSRESWELRYKEKDSLFLDDIIHVKRCCSKTHTYAFEVSTDEAVVIAMAANSETEAQSWMMILRAIFWPPPKPMPVIEATDKVFRVNIIDNEASASLCLEGAYVLQCCARLILLLSAANGTVVHEWLLTSLARLYIPAMPNYVDKNRILAVVTGSHGKVNSTPFQFFCADAKTVLDTIKERIEKSLTLQVQQSVQGYVDDASGQDFRRYSADAVMDSDASPDNHRRSSLPSYLELGKACQRSAKAPSITSIPSITTESNTESDYDKLSIHSPKILTSVNTVSLHNHRNHRVRQLNYSLCRSDLDSYSDDSMSLYPITTNVDDLIVSTTEVQTEGDPTKEQEQKDTLAVPLTTESPYVYTVRERSSTDPVIPNSPRLDIKLRRHSASTVRKKESVIKIRKKKRLSISKRTRRWQVRQRISDLSESDADTEKETMLPKRQPIKKQQQPDSGTKKRSNTLERRGAFRGPSTRNTQQRPYIQKREESRDDDSSTTEEPQKPTSSKVHPPEKPSPGDSCDVAINNKSCDNYQSLNAAAMKQHGQLIATPAPPPLRRRVPISKLGKSMSMIESPSMMATPISRPSSMHDIESMSNLCDDTKYDGSELAHIYMDLDTIKDLKEKLQKWPIEESSKLNEMFESSCKAHGPHSQTVKSYTDLSEREPDISEHSHVEKDTHTDTPVKVASSRAGELNHSLSDNDSTDSIYELTKYLYPPSIFPIRSVSDPDREKFLRFREKRRQSAPPTLNVSRKPLPQAKSRSIEVLEQNNHQTNATTGEHTVGKDIRKFSVPARMSPTKRTFKMQRLLSTKNEQGVLEKGPGGKYAIVPSIDPGVIMEVCDEDIGNGPESSMVASSGKGHDIKGATEESINSDTCCRSNQHNGVLPECKVPYCQHSQGTVIGSSPIEQAIDVARSRSQTLPCPRGRCPGICQELHVHVGKSTFFNEPTLSETDTSQDTSNNNGHSRAVNDGSNKSNKRVGSACSSSHVLESKTRTQRIEAYHSRSISAPVDDPRDIHEYEIDLLDRSDELATKPDANQTYDTEAELRNKTTPSCNDFILMNKNEKYQKQECLNELERSCIGYRSLPIERRNNGGITATSPIGKLKRKERNCPEPTRKNLTKYLGIPEDLENPMEAPPSLPDRPKQMGTISRGSKTNRIKQTVMTALGLSPKGKTADIVDLESSDEQKNSQSPLHSVATWPLDLPQQSAKRKSISQTNDLYTRQGGGTECRILGSSTDTDTDIASLIFENTAVSAKSNGDTEPGKTMPAPFSPIIDDSYIRKMSQSSIAWGECMGTPEGRISPLESNDEKQAFDQSLTAALSEHMVCWSGCPHLRQSPFASLESSPAFTPHHSRHGSDEIVIPIQHCRTFSQSPEQESPYMNMGQVVPRNADATSSHHGNVVKKISEETYISMDEIHRLQQQMQQLTDSDAGSVGRSLQEQRSDSDDGKVMSLEEMFAMQEEDTGVDVDVDINLPTSTSLSHEESGHDTRTRRPGVVPTSCPHVIEVLGLRGHSEA